MLVADVSHPVLVQFSPVSDVLYERAIEPPTLRCYRRIVVGHNNVEGTGYRMHRRSLFCFAGKDTAR